MLREYRERRKMNIINSWFIINGRWLKFWFHAQRFNLAVSIVPVIIESDMINKQFPFIMRTYARTIKSASFIANNSESWLDSSLEMMM